MHTGTSLALVAASQIQSARDERRFVPRIVEKLRRK